MPAKKPVPRKPAAKAPQRRQVSRTPKKAKPPAKASKRSPAIPRQPRPEPKAHSSKPRGSGHIKHAIRHKDGGAVVVDRWTPRRAIAAMCTECMGWGSEHPRRCKGPLCPLFPHRRKINIALSREGGERISEEEARLLVMMEEEKRERFRKPEAEEPEDGSDLEEEDAEEEAEDES